MNLKKLRQYKNKRFTTFIFKLMELIKAEVCLPPNARLFYLDIFNENYYFCYKNTVFVTSCYLEQEIRNSNFDINKVKLTNLYSIVLLNEYPKTSNEIVFSNLIKDEKYNYTIEQFLEWIDSPSQLTLEVDVPHYQIISFLTNYRPLNFRTDKYIYYTKRDKEFCCCCLHLYAKEIKTGKEVILYAPTKSKNDEVLGWIKVAPSHLKDFIAISVTDNVTKYQLIQVKKDFLNFKNNWCEELNCNNYFALELVKQAIQPIEQFHEWGIHRIFAGRDKNNQPKKFTNIWVEDFIDDPRYPFFFLTNHPITWVATRIIPINFKEPSYYKYFKSNYNIYKKGTVKYKLSTLDKQQIKELIKFLSTPIELEEYEKNKYGNLVKTNWQKLIFEYNHNTCGWGWGSDGYKERLTDCYEGYETLPFDLPIPDYTKLLDDKFETQVTRQNLGYWTREMLKPKNLIGPFDSVDDLMKSTWDDNETE